MVPFVGLVDKEKFLGKHFHDVVNTDGYRDIRIKCFPLFDKQIGQVVRGLKRPLPIE